MTRSIVKKFLTSRAGMAYMEFALFLPILMMLFTGAYEYSRFILLSQRLEKLAFSTGLIISQSLDVTETQSEIDGMFSAGEKLMEPFPFGSEGRLYVSFIQYDTATAGPKVIWQDDMGTLAETSNIGIVGQAASLPAGITVQQGYGLVVAEVFYDYQPLWFSFTLGSNAVQRMEYRSTFRTMMLAS